MRPLYWLEAAGMDTSTVQVQQEQRDRKSPAPERHVLDHSRKIRLHLLTSVFVGRPHREEANYRPEQRGKK